jgi:hypothetical protein
MGSISFRQHFPSRGCERNRICNFLEISTLVSLLGNGELVSRYRQVLYLLEREDKFLLTFHDKANSEPGRKNGLKRVTTEISPSDTRRFDPPRQEAWERLSNGLASA